MIINFFLLISNDIAHWLGYYGYELAPDTQHNLDIVKYQLEHSAWALKSLYIVQSKHNQSSEDFAEADEKTGKITKNLVDCSERDEQLSKVGEMPNQKIKMLKESWPKSKTFAQQ